jgi:hypothetical protein
MAVMNPERVIEAARKQLCEKAISEFERMIEQNDYVGTGSLSCAEKEREEDVQKLADMKAELERCFPAPVATDRGNVSNSQKKPRVITKWGVYDMGKLISGDDGSVLIVGSKAKAYRCAQSGEEIVKVLITPVIGAKRLIKVKNGY